MQHVPPISIFSIIKHVTLQKIVAHDFRYDLRSCRLVTLLKIFDDPIEVSNIIDIIVSFNFINFSSNVVLPFFVLYLLVLRLTLFR